jgi:hypothetical protein
MNQDEFNFDDSQEEHLRRVRSKIARAVLEFCDAHTEFHAAQLRAYVVAQELVAPASPDRILRDLRQKGFLDYEVIDRRASLYRVKYVRK